MNLTVKLKDLQRIVGLVSTVTPTRTTLPTLNAVLLQYYDCELSARATDLRSFAQAGCEAVGEQSGAFGVRADLLQSFLGGCTAEDVEIAVDKRATIQCGTMRAILTVLIADEFQAHPEVEGPCVLLGAKELHSALGKVLHAASDDTAGKGTLCSVCFDFVPTLHLAAFSGAQLATVSMGVAGSGQFIAPRHLVSSLLKAINGHEGEVGVTFSERAMRFSAEGWSMTGLLIDGKFPPWQRVTEWVGMPKFTFKRTDLLGAFRNCVPFGEAGFTRIYVHGDNGTATIEIAGENASSSEVPYQGDPFLFFVDAKKIISILSALSDDNVTLEYKDEQGKGIVIHENNFTAAVMPLEK